MQWSLFVEKQRLCVLSGVIYLKEKPICILYILINKIIQELLLLL